MKPAVSLICLSGEPPVLYAAEELSKYLSLLGCSVDPASPNTLWLGLMDEHATQALKDPALDDAILVDVENMNGRIQGSNPRSVLFAVYRFLKALGIYFIRPGETGCIVRPTNAPSVHINECASYRHRGICIEGALHFHEALDMVDWLCKNSCNTYFTQFFAPYEFFERGSVHPENELLQNTETPPTEEDALNFTYQDIQSALEKRGMVFQAIGHGWTAAAVGIRKLGWSVYDQPLDEEFVPFLAQLDGKRALFEGRPLNTNLCYGNEKVIDAMVRQIVTFLTDHPGIDIAHVWLADAYNNSCECPLCADKLPSEHYVHLLNAIDRALTKAKIATRIVFLGYFDLLWPPKKEKIEHPERFIFMFAPITRSYSSPLPIGEKPQPLPTYVRNHAKFSSSVSEALSFLKAWQAVAPTDSFIFDYHYMWDLYKDISDYSNAKLLHEDIRRLKELGLNGYISCQVTRGFLPFGLGMQALAQTLWNREVDFDQMASQHFEAVFGMDAPAMQKLFTDFCVLWDARYLRGEKQPEPDAKEKLNQLVKMLMSARGLCAKKARETTGNNRVTWEDMVFWTGYAALYAQFVKSSLQEDKEAVKTAYAALKAYVCVDEPLREERFDTDTFLRTAQRTVLRLFLDGTKSML